MFRSLSNILIKKSTLRKVVKKGCVSFYPTQTQSAAQSIRMYTPLLDTKNKICLNFINRKGEKMILYAAPDDTLLDVVIDNDLDIESFGVCEGTLGCSTCHVIFEEKIFNLLEETCPPTAEEMDMLDLACGLTETSRLACQVEISKSLEGMTVKVPKEAIDARDL